MKRKSKANTSRIGIIFLVLTLLVTSLVSINVTSVSAASFPYNAVYKYGFSSVADNQDEANAIVLKEWEDWKSKRITSNGAGGFKRVQRDSSTGFDTVSEGLGYGMILAVYFNEQALFNDLYGYVKLHLNNNGLMSWQIDASGNVVGSGGWGCATDADEDIAVALVFAHKQWGSSGSVNYGQEARNFINNLANKCLDGDVLKPGDGWGGWNTTNPSYFAPAWYKIFAQFTGDTRWNSVVDKCYEIAENAKKYNNGTGLVPDWCKGDATAASGMGYNYSYDACRYPWRTVLDYLWFGDERAKTNCDLLNKFFSGIGAANIKSGYTITGQTVGSDHNSTFVATAAAAAMTGYDLDYAKAMYAENIKVVEPDAYSYYGGCLKMFTMLYMTGNFPNLYEEIIVPSPTPTIMTPTPTKATPTPTHTGNLPEPGDVNFDGAVNSIDFAYMRMKLLGMIDSFPSDHGAMAADVSGDGAFNSIDFGYMRMKLLGMIDVFPIR